jgi:hypothetical protein
MCLTSGEITLIFHGGNPLCLKHLKWDEYKNCHCSVSIISNNNNNPWSYSSDEPWPAEQPPLAVFPDCTRRYWVDMWSAHRIPQLHFQLSKLDRYFFIQVTTQFI